MENFGLHHHVIGIANALLDIGNLFARETGYDAIDQCSANVAVFGEPVLELLIIGTEIIFPKFNVLVDTLFQVVTIEEDKFARHDNQSLGFISFEGFEATIKQLSQFTGIGTCRGVCQLARG